ncbi:MAG: class I SAM-dependent methyltransferase [Brachybacterium tyrofermentans]|uniref:Class I SAM-dependent methyltransferase n=1 Tax=Brachybacterium tyrofermentans TaxID=47848 RepID=A0ABW0FDL9_9MICO|nr:23S rRNA (guanine-N-2-)-methyltransferase rlmG [Corynebacterium xerosis]
MPHTPAADDSAATASTATPATATDSTATESTASPQNPTAPTAAQTPQGADQTDRVIMAAAEEAGIGCPCDVIVVDDATGALTDFALAAVAEHEDAKVLSWTSSTVLAATLAERFATPLAAGRLLLPVGPQPVELGAAAARVEGHQMVLMRLPKSLHALEDRARRLAEAVRGRGDGGLELIAGGRVKHMTRSQNDVLAKLFTEVRASRGIGKSRALIGTGLREQTAGPTPTESTTRIVVRGQQRSLSLRGVGTVFGGSGADAGSLLLLSSLDQAVAAGELATEESPVRSAADLGCGNGLMTSYLAAALPEASVLGSDEDADAVASTRATLAANDLEREDIELVWDDAFSQVADRSLDLVLLNPPFHDGTAIDATLVDGLLDAASRVLRPGGQLWFVHNSHLRYRTEVERRVGPVRQRARDRRFTVLSAERV